MIPCPKVLLILILEKVLLMSPIKLIPHFAQVLADLRALLIPLINKKVIPNLGLQLTWSLPLMIPQNLEKNVYYLLNILFMSIPFIFNNCK